MQISEYYTPDKIASAVMKMTGIFGMFYGAYHYAYISNPPNMPMAENLFFGAVFASGVGWTAHRSSLNAEIAAKNSKTAIAVSLENTRHLGIIAADTASIRNDPAMPGLPLTEEELESREPARTSAADGDCPRT